MPKPIACGCQMTRPATAQQEGFTAECALPEGHPGEHDFSTRRPLASVPRAVAPLFRLSSLTPYGRVSL